MHFLSAMSAEAPKESEVSCGGPDRIGSQLRRTRQNRESPAAAPTESGVIWLWGSGPRQNRVKILMAPTKAYLSLHTGGKRT